MNDTQSSLAEGYEKVVTERRSVRGFLEKPVPPDVLARIFQVAQRAPSNCNVQPWLVYVASGACRDRMRADLAEQVQNGVNPAPEYEEKKRFEGEYRKRQVDCAVALYKSMSIGRDDREGRLRASLRNYEFFDAPHVAFIGMPKEYGPILLLDVGMYAQTLMLAMTAHGLGSCPQASLCDYPDVVRREFDIGDDIAIVMGLSFGYEDVSVPANSARTTREDLATSVSFKA